MKPGIQCLLSKVSSPTWLICPLSLAKRLLEHELRSLLRPCAPFPELPSQCMGGAVCTPEAFLS